MVCSRKGRWSVQWVRGGSGGAEHLGEGKKLNRVSSGTFSNGYPRSVFSLLYGNASFCLLGRRSVELVLGSWKPKMESDLKDCPVEPPASAGPLLP